MKVLVTGGSGFIGSHTCVELAGRGHEIVVLDDYSNSWPAALSAAAELAGQPLTSYQADMRDVHALRAVFGQHKIDAVIHFAGKKSVRESVQIPVDYFDVNVTGTVNLVRVMLEHGVRQLVFSSSCSIYGDRYRAPITEDDPPGPTNPYARSKLICEQILASTCARHDDLSVVSLRYFNPVGGHPSGRLGEDPRGVPGNLMPYMMQVAVGRLERLHVFGGDYPTEDGTCVRDYIHVMDVAGAHCLALEHAADEAGLRVFNLGTGAGVSVLQLLAAFEQAAGVTVPYQIVERQAGDVTSLIADASRIDKEWGWRTTRDLTAMCEDAWRFQQRHPNGYRH